MVIGGTKSGYYNVPIEILVDFCVISIINNTPVQFSCDVNHYMHPDNNLFDTKIFDYNLLFGMNFDSMTKQEMMNMCESYATHAMVLVGVDLDKNGKPLKWKVENLSMNTYRST